MKNGKIEAQIEMQEKVDTSINAYKQTGRDANLSTSSLVDLNQSNSESTIQPTKMPNLGLSSALGLLTPELNNTEEQQIPVKRKKKKPKRGFRR